VSIQIQQKLHGVYIANFECLVKQREYKEAAVRAELYTHHLICSLNLFIELELHIPRGATLSQSIELDLSVC
jgi:hypothetical protein